jgi:hypothetical protein
MRASKAHPTHQQEKPDSGLCTALRNSCAANKSVACCTTCKDGGSQQNACLMHHLLLHAWSALITPYHITNRRCRHTSAQSSTAQTTRRPHTSRQTNQTSKLHQGSAFAATQQAGSLPTLQQRFVMYQTATHAQLALTHAVQPQTCCAMQN